MSGLVLLAGVLRKMGVFHRKVVSEYILEDYELSDENQLNALIST